MTSLALMLPILSAAPMLLPVGAGESTPSADQRPRIDVLYDDGGDDASGEPSMRFGIVLHDLQAGDKTVTGLKQLTFGPRGETNNTCVRVDSSDRLFGLPPGKWQGPVTKLAKDAAGNQRLGCQCVWAHDKAPVEVTQTVEIIRGKQTTVLDTCRVAYAITNKDSKAHKVGLRFLLDTLVGTSDGSPYIVPGAKVLCDTQAEFKDPATVPDFIYALENAETLNRPGVVAYLNLKVGGKLEAPSRVTLGAWPDPESGVAGAEGQGTLWNVPVFSMRKLSPPDSAAVLYWDSKELEPGGRRELGFTYGLGYFSSDRKGDLGLFLAGPFKAGAEMTVLALVYRPRTGQTVTLKPPKSFEILAGTLTQTVASLPRDGTQVAPITWRVRTSTDGVYPVIVESSSGAVHTQPVRIN
jgi:hypothetical protein